MFSSFLNALQPPSERTPVEVEDIPKSPISQAAHKLHSLHLLDQDDFSFPGAFSSSPTIQNSTDDRPRADNQRSPALSPLIRGLNSLHLEDMTLGTNDHSQNGASSSALEQLETLITAATITSEPMDTSSHSKLFTSSSEFYERRGSMVPDSLQSLDMSTAMQSLNAVISSNKRWPLPAVRPGRQFGRQSTPVYSQAGRGGKPPSTSLAPPAEALGKAASDEVELLVELNEKLSTFQLEILDDAFDALTEDTKCEKLDKASAFVNDTLAHMAKLEGRAKARAIMADRRDGKVTLDVSKDTRASLIQSLKTFHAQLCLLDAPLLTKQPTVIDADYVYNQSFTNSNQITQVLVLLAVICNMIIGLSTDQCEFLLHTAVMCVKLGMSTVSSHVVDAADDFTPSQNAIIQNMPTSLSAALKKFGADGRFELYASCPSCCCNHKATCLPGPNLYQYPEKCKNQIVGETGVSFCGTELLTRRRDGAMQPIKPYLVSSLSDYLARCLADETYLQQSVAATDEAFDIISRGEEHVGSQNVFESNFIKDFKGPDEKLFVDRGDKIRLAFSLHVDFFNPNRNTHAGAHQSVGIISGANLALDPSIRNLPEYLYPAAIIPGPFEPKTNDTHYELDHFIRPVIEQFVQAWRPGIRVSRTATSETEVTVEAGILLSVNDLVAARKVAGLASHTSAFICSICRLTGKTGLFNTDHSQWIPRDRTELFHQAVAWRDAQTVKERKNLFNKYGVRWTSFWLLDYWDPTRQLVIDSMHCILEGLVQYQCRQVLRLDASKRQVNSDGIKYAFDWQWSPYEAELAPVHIEMNSKHIPQVAKVQDTLCWAIEGDRSSSLDQMWTRLEGQVLSALQFVAWSLELPLSLENIDPGITSLYVERGKRNSKKKNRDTIRFPAGRVASQKKHFIALLLDWRLKQPHDSSDFIAKTGDEQTLNWIQRVIRDTIRPAWVDSVPKNFGEKSAGSVKAAEWRTLSSLHLPIALVIRWGDADGSAPPEDDSEAGYLLKVLDHTMALFQATIVALRHSMSVRRANIYRKYHAEWVKGLTTFFPRAREGKIKANIHAAGHIFDFLLLFGPVMSWWCFPFERLIGALQKINTNDHIGGEMEATIIKSVTRTANIRRWLRRPDCPEAVRQLKVMFDKCFKPVNGMVKEENQPQKGSRRAYAKWDSANFSPSTTHPGNATIIYRPSPAGRPVGGVIQEIRNVNTSGIQVRVHPFESLPASLYDPFSRYPHLSAKSYSSTLREESDMITLDAIVAHAARFDYTHNRTVLVNLCRD